jgi:hypothetical protein
MTSTLRHHYYTIIAGELSYVDTYKEYAQSWIDYVSEVVSCYTFVA